MKVLLIGSRALERQGPGDAKMAFWTWKALAGAGHEVSIIVLHPAGLPGRALRTLKALVNARPLQLGYTTSPASAHRIEQLTRAHEPDLVIAVHARAAAHVPLRLRSRALALLIDAYGQNYRTYAGRVGGPMALVYRLEQGRMDAYEASVVETFARTAVVSELDRQYLSRKAGRPGSVLRMTLPIDVEFLGETRRHVDPRAPVFAFLGRLNYLPNRDAVRRLAVEIWPVLKRRWPHARLRIIGASADRAQQRLLAKAGLELLANVPDIRRSLEDVTALLVPMRMGGGIQQKVLEAMACGVPVISTPFGARGLGLRPGVELLEAESVEGYGEAVGRLLGDAALAERLAAVAKTWVVEHHAPALFEREMLSLCAELLAANRPVS